MISFHLLFKFKFLLHMWSSKKTTSQWLAQSRKYWIVRFPISLISSVVRRRRWGFLSLFISENKFNIMRDRRNNGSIVIRIKLYWIFTQRQDRTILICWSKFRYHITLTPFDTARITSSSSRHTFVDWPKAHILESWGRRKN